ncbi:MAG: NADH-quinone oxidoreductase subunit C [Oligoflexia bacterium]|nr:NADH-quinone oxidoreductase subunit C [Oligoflexia bacterium]
MIFDRGRIAGPEPVPFGWVDGKSLRRLVEALRADQEISADHLENISVAQVGDALMVTYFFRAAHGCFALRATAVPAEPNAWVSFPTVRDLWPMAAPMENYSCELFGIRFVGADGVELEIEASLVLKAKDSEAGSRGFPLRKNFVVGGSSS